MCLYYMVSAESRPCSPPMWCLHAKKGEQVSPEAATHLKVCELLVTVLFCINYMAAQCCDPERSTA